MKLFKINIFILNISFLLFSLNTYCHKKSDLEICALHSNKLVNSVKLNDTVTIKYQIPDSLKKNFTYLFINEFAVNDFKSDSTEKIDFILEEYNKNLNPEDKPWIKISIGIGNSDSAIIKKSIKLIYKPFLLLSLAGNPINEAEIKDNIKVRFFIEQNIKGKIYVNNTPIGNLKKYTGEPGMYSFVLENVLQKSDSLYKILEPGNSFSKKVSISIGNSLDDMKVITNDFTIIFDKNGKSRKIASLITLVILFILIVLIIPRKRFDILRDSTAKDTETAKYIPPYSLSRSQMAFWTVIILIAYFIVWWFTGSIIQITGQVLALLGISAGTTIGGHLIDNEDLNKQGTVRHQESNDSKSFFLNILSDHNGLSIHRFQNVVFTIAIACYFLYEVIRNHKIPTLDNNMMLLMGISSGTYLAIKKGENKAHKDQLENKTD